METAQKSLIRLKKLYEVPSGARKIPLCPSYYVTRDGRTVFSFIKMRPLKQQMSSSGYLQVWLRDDVGVFRWYGVHRLVADLFIYNPKGLHVVGHKDGDRRNNSVGNLYWTTRRGNTEEMIDSGKMPWQKEGWVSPMKGRSHGEKTKSLMSVAKLGKNHPKFKGYYVYDGKRFSSLQAIADYMGTYVMKVKRMFDKGLIGRD